MLLPKIIKQLENLDLDVLEPFAHNNQVKAVEVCSETYSLNLMLFANLPEDTWKESYYTSVAEITFSEKRLSKWVKGKSHELFLL